MVKLDWYPASAEYNDDTEDDDEEKILYGAFITNKFGEKNHIGRFVITQLLMQEGILYTLTYRRDCECDGQWQEYSLFQWFFHSLKEAKDFAEYNVKVFIEINTGDDEAKKLLESINMKGVKIE